MLTRVAKYYPQEQKLAINSLENMGAKEIKNFLRHHNAALNCGEFNKQLGEWILEKEDCYISKIRNRLNTVGNHKLQLTYHGMIYIILEYTGCYLKGKNSSPIGITRTKYCSVLNLENRLRSNNVRKSIANDIYGHNYMRAITERENNEEENREDPTLVSLESVFKDLLYDLEKEIFKTK